MELRSPLGVVGSGRSNAWNISYSRTAHHRKIHGTPGVVVIVGAALRSVGDIGPVLVSQQRSSRGQIDFAGDRRYRVADLLGFEALAVGSPEQRVLRVNLRCLLVIVRAHPISAGKHDQAVHILDRPLLIDELNSQPVQQRLIGGHLAQPTEIIGRRHDAAPEMPAPQAVRHHTAGQRMIRPREPFGQLQSSALCVGNGRLVLARDHAQETARHFLAQRPVAAADVNLRIRDLVAFPHPHSLRQIRRSVFQSFLSFSSFAISSCADCG